MSEQDVTEATTADVPEDSGEQASAPSPVAAAPTEPEATAPAEAPVDEQVDAQSAADAEAEADADRTLNGVVVFDDLGGLSFADAVDATIVEFDDGDIVTGRVVKIDTDEVLLDIGFKSEGVIPSRELSIRNDVDPHEIVSLDDEL
ncbi:MAG TPA: S1 RNA-binding domain-containing protein, partial [Acidimicrobiia bacterium]|nr:S1 RNA-binding domain-containing protein [Acidimicrobiia bacterium]